jgi:hypothetical protein
MNRREVLQLVSSGAMALGTARSPLRERAAGPLADDSWDQDRHGTGPTRLEGDHVSFRDLARRMDFARPARRVWGNGPLSADRPDASCGELVTYRGTEYVPYPGVAARYAYDLGMINRFEDTGGDDSVVALTDLSEKGILECHRFVTAEETETGSTASGGSSTADGGYSLRAVADRHRRGVAHRCLWLNTRLVEDAKDIARRDHLIGEVLGVSGSDIVGLGEVFREAQFDELVEHYRQSSVGPIDVERGPARARCCGLAAVVATENGKRGIDGEDKWESVYDVDVPPSVPWDTLDGAQRVTVTTRINPTRPSWRRSPVPAPCGPKGTARCCSKSSPADSQTPPARSRSRPAGRL